MILKREWQSICSTSVMLTCVQVTHLGEREMHPLPLPGNKIRLLHFITGNFLGKIPWRRGKIEHVIMHCRLIRKNTKECARNCSH